MTNKGNITVRKQSGIFFAKKWLFWANFYGYQFLQKLIIRTILEKLDLNDYDSTVSDQWSKKFKKYNPLRV